MKTENTVSVRLYLSHELLDRLRAIDTRDRWSLSRLTNAAIEAALFNPMLIRDLAKYADRGVRNTNETRSPN